MRISDWSSDVCSSDLQEQQRSEAMRELWKLWTAAMIGLCLATLPLASAAAAQASPAAAPENSPSDLAREGLESMLRALRLLVESIPQYELPEEIGRAHVRTPVTNAHLVCRPHLEKKKLHSIDGCTRKSQVTEHQYK